MRLSIGTSIIYHNYFPGSSSEERKFYEISETFNGSKGRMRHAIKFSGHVRLEDACRKFKESAEAAYKKGKGGYSDKFYAEDV